MFSISSREENGFDLVVLTDNTTNTQVEIIPACGAILHAFKVQHRGSTINVVEQYSSEKEFCESVEEKGFKSCKLSPFVCRLRDGKYHFAEKEYTIGKFYLGKNALHGIIYDARFEIVQSIANTVLASVELLFSYKGTDKGYPFKYDCRIVYELKQNASLTITTIIKNHEAMAIPVADGWHPYFTFCGRVDDLLLSFQTKEMLESDDELIPTKRKIPFSDFKTLRPIGNTSLDNGFMVDFENNGPVLVLRDVHKKIQLEINPGKSYPVLQLYIPDHRQSIAIENLSAAPDAFNNQIGLTVLPAGKEVSFQTNFHINNDIHE